MATKRRFGKKLFRLLLPILLILLVALVVALVSIVYGITRPPRRSLLITPQTFSQISGTARALRVTDETWRNRDGTAARGWLLRGAEGSPAVILLHRYGGDRSLLFNLGMKINEATTCTVLWPDMRGHGLNPPVNWTSFGSREGDDLLAAIDFLRSLKSDRGQQIGEHIGVYGVELGAYATLRVASKDAGIQVLVLDSVPRDQNELVEAATRTYVGISTPVLVTPARFATRLYFLRLYDNRSSCELLEGLDSNRRILLLAGEDDGRLRDSTKSLTTCFSNRANLETKTDLPLTGFTLPSATGELGEGYDRPVIDFFIKNLH